MDLIELQKVGLVSDTVIQGDCLEAMDILIQKWIKVDAIITDPPYW
jgi:DNA modification methylase